MKGDYNFPLASALQLRQRNTSFCSLKGDIPMMKTNEAIFKKFVPSAAPSSKAFLTVAPKDAHRITKVTFEFMHTVFSFNPKDFDEILDVLEFYLGEKALEYDEDIAEILLHSLLRLMPAEIFETPEKYPEKSQEIIGFLLGMKSAEVLKFLLENVKRWTPELFSLLVAEYSVKDLPEEFVKPFIKNRIYRQIIQLQDCGFKWSYEAQIYMEKLLPSAFWKN